jgi:hypothetical protein
VSAILGEQHVVPLAAHIWLRLSFRLNFDFFFVFSVLSEIFPLYKIR